MNKLALLVGSSLVAGLTFAADQESAITQSTDLELTVPSGTTWTYDKTITLTDGAKLVKKGPGTLVLSATDNAFDGGIDLQQGTLQADAEGAFGSQKITMSTTTSRLLVFNADNATFPNEIEQTAAGSYAWNTYHIQILKTTHLTSGILSTAGALCISVYTSGQTLTIDGDVNVGENTFELEDSTTVTFNGSVTCNMFRSGRGYGSKGTVHFANPVNRIAYIRQDATDVYPDVDGALDGVGFLLQNRWYSDSKSGIKLEGKRQKIAYLDASTTSPAIDAYANEAGGNIRSSSETTLTIVGGTTTSADDAKTAYCRYYVGYGSERINIVLDAPDFTQVFMERGGAAYSHHTTGWIAVSNGTFRVTDKVQFANVPEMTVAENGVFESAITTGTTFGKLTKLRVAGKLTVEEGTLLPFLQGEVDLELEENAEVYLPADMAFTVKSLKIGGVPQAPGLYNVDQIKSGAIVIPGGAAAWTGEGREDTAITLPANWGGTLPDILFGSTALRFATGGNVATVGSACRFGGVTLDAAGGFTFAKADDAARIEAAGISVVKDAGASEDVRTYAFEPPVTLKSTAATLAQTLDVPANDTVSFVGGLDLTGTSAATLTKTGAGTVTFGDGTVVQGWIQHNEGEMRISGTFGTPGHVDQGGAGSWQWGPSLYMDATQGKSQTLVLDGATIEKPFFGKRATRLFDTVSNTTNEFKGAFAMQDPASEVPANGPDGHLWFKGGLSCSWSMTSAGGGTLHVCDYRTDTVARTNDIRNINAGNNTRVVFEGVQNRIYEGIYFPYGAAVVEFKQSFATVEPIAKIYFGNQYGSGSSTNTLDLGSTTQRVAVISNNNSGRTRAEVICGNAGSALEITGDDPNDSSSVVNWAGAVSLLKSGTSQMVMRYRECPSTGDVTVTGGELRFEDGASWRNGAKVTVAQTGRLSVSQTDTFGRDVSLELNDDGVISVAEGATVRAAKLTVDGVEIGPGRYTYATAPDALKAHLDPDAAGAVSVKGGFVLLVR